MADKIHCDLPPIANPQVREGHSECCSVIQITERSFFARHYNAPIGGGSRDGRDASNDQDTTAQSNTTHSDYQRDRVAVWDS
jgi:hypothetical protein